MVVLNTARGGGVMLVHVDVFAGSEAHVVAIVGADDLELIDVEDFVLGLLREGFRDRLRGGEGRCDDEECGEVRALQHAVDPFIQIAMFGAYPLWHDWVLYFGVIYGC